MICTYNRHSTYHYIWGSGSVGEGIANGEKMGSVGLGSVVGSEAVGEGIGSGETKGSVEGKRISYIQLEW